MVKQLQFKMLLLLCALMVGSGSVWATDYVKVTNASDLVSGEVYIIANSDGIATSFNTSKQSLSITDAGYTEEDGVITTSSATPMEFTLGMNGSNYTLLSGSYFLGYNGSSTDLRYSATTATDTKEQWTISYNSEYSMFTIVNVPSSRHLGYNKSDAFKAYAASNMANNAPATLYKKQSTSPAISASNVNYTADITSGEILYSIINPVVGESLTATTTTEWITLGDVTSTKVPFTMTENVVGTERVGTITLKYEGATDKVVTVTQAAAVIKYTVTIVTPDNGTLTVRHGGVNVASGNKIPDGTTLDIITTPNTGYRLLNWQAVDADTHTYTAETTYTIDGHNVTISANFETIPQYSYTWSVDGVVTKSETLVEGADVVFPAVSTPTGSDKVFYGWVTTSTVNPDTNPTLASTTSVTATANTTYYAVFARLVASTGWEKKTVSEITEEGTYALITTDGHAFNGNISSGHGQTTTDAFSFDSNNFASSAPTGTCEITFKAVTGGFEMYNAGKGYLYASKASSGGLAWQNSESYYWSYTSNNWRYSRNYSGSYAFLRVYNNTFRTYNSNTNQGIAFAKKTSTQAYSDYCTIVTATGTITMNSACTDGSVIYGTYYTNRAYVMPENMVGQVVSVDNNGTLTVEDAYEEDDVVPANTALLLYTIDDFTGTNDYTINYTNETGSDWSDYNMLKGTLTADEETEGTNCLFYRLTMHNGTQIGFWWGAENGGAFAPGANKAYLAVPQQQNEGNARQGFAFGDGPTGISTLVNSEKVNGEVFDLQGRRVAQPTKGLYIVNGKKVLVK